MRAGRDRCAARRSRRQVHAQWPERVVGDLARPHEIPQRGEEESASSAVPAAVTKSGQNDVPRARRGARGSCRAADRRAPRAATTDDASRKPPDRGRTRPHASVPSRRRARRPRSTPARRLRTNRRASRGGSPRRARATHRVRAPTPGSRRPGAARSLRRARRFPRRRAPDALPRRGSTVRRRAGVDRLDFVAERGQRTAPQRPEHARVAPVTLDAARTELAVHDAAGGFEVVHRFAGPFGADAETRGNVVEHERNVSARETGDEIVERVVRRVR